MKNQDTFTFIEGETIDFLPLKIENVNLYARWENNPKVRLYSRNILPRTVEEMKKYLEPSDKRPKNEVSFEIWHKKDKKIIGFGEVSDINWYNQQAYLGLLIGEPDYWGQKIGEEATRLLVEYAFNELNIFKLKASILVVNEGSWRCAEKNGFTRVATCKKDMYVNGEYLDNYVYSLLKEDWLKLKK